VKEPKGVIARPLESEGNLGGAGVVGDHGRSSASFRRSVLPLEVMGKEGR